MHVIQRPKFIIKLGEYFFPSLTISRVQNFISLNLKEKSRRYAFSFYEHALKIKIPSKKSKQAATMQGDLILALTLSLLMPRYLAQPFNVIKRQLKFNPAAYGLKG
jgi:hypothetical protein